MREAERRSGWRRGEEGLAGKVEGGGGEREILPLERAEDVLTWINGPCCTHLAASPFCNNTTCLHSILHV